MHGDRIPPLRVRFEPKEDGYRHVFLNDVEFAWYMPRGSISWGVHEVTGQRTMTATFVVDEVEGE